MTRAESRAMDALNQAFAKMVGNDPLWGSLLPQHAGYTYWSNARGDMFFYTKEKVNHHGKPRYVSGIYRHLVTYKKWKLLREAGAVTKRRAMNRAYRLWQEDDQGRGGKPAWCWTCHNWIGWHTWLLGRGKESRRICDDCKRRENYPADAELRRAYR